VLYAAERDPRVRELYFARRSHGNDIALLREWIEASGAREYTERQARNAYDHAMASLDAARLEGPAAEALRDLAQSLLGRES
jgi:geranylgeranyl pyrophosphate synthase